MSKEERIGIPLAILLTIVMIGYFVWYPSYQSAQLNKNAEAVESVLEEQTARNQAAALEARIQLVRHHYGYATGDRFERCIKDPPTTEQHKIECQELIGKVNKYKASLPIW